MKNKICPSLHFRHKWISVDHQPVCVWCGRVKDEDDTGKPKPDNSKPKRKDRKRKAKIKHKIHKRLKRQYKRIQKRKKGRACK